MKMHAMVMAVAMLAPAAMVAQEKASIMLDGQAINITYAPAAAKKYVVATMQVTADVAFKGIKVPKGSYSLYVLPEGAEWKLAVNKAPAAKAAVYDAKLDIGRVAMTMAKGTATAPKITLTKTAAVAARIDVAWNGNVASTRMHLDRGGNSNEW